MSSPLTTHVLDTARGKPAAGVPVTLERQDGSGFVTVSEAETNDDGRVVGLVAAEAFTPGVWRMSFDTASYFEALGTRGFYPVVRVVFEVTDPSEHHHVPLLLSPFGYSTYRGS